MNFPRVKAIRREAIVVFSSATFLLTLALGIAQESQPPLKAGLAKIDITPSAAVQLSGYASRKELSEGIHDPLSARIVAFENRGNWLILVSTDLIGFYDGSLDMIRETILSRCSVPSESLWLTAIHTHSGPSLAVSTDDAHPSNVQYTKELGEKLADAVQAAMESAGPVDIAVGTGFSPVGVNRREVVTDTSGARQIVLGRNPNASTDPEVQVVSLTQSDQKEPAALLFAYATHSTSLGSKNLAISGDIHGLSEQFVEGQLGKGIIAAAFAGASGDIDPWFRVLPGFQQDGRWVPEPVLLGTMLGEEVVHTLARMKKVSEPFVVKSVLKTLMLPGKPISEAATAEQPKKVPLNLTVGSVGDIGLVGIGGEVFNQIGRNIKDKSPFPCTMVMTHCNGAAGYLPTAESYPEGGYEIRSSPFAPEAAAQVEAETIALLNHLRDAGRKSK